MDGFAMDARQAEDQDREDLLLLRSKLWPDTDPETHRLEIRKMAARPDRWATFVYPGSDGRLLGFVEVSLREDATSIHRDRIGYLEGWFVEPSHRRQGIGRKLVKAAEAWARQHGCSAMASDADLDDAQSHRAHAALGYLESGREVLFRKSLD